MRKTLRISAPLGYDPRDSKVADLRKVRQDEKEKKEEDSTVGITIPYITTVTLDPMTSVLRINIFYSGATDIKDLFLEPKDLQILLELYASDLLKPVILPVSDYCMERKVKRQRLEEIVKVLVKSLRIDAYGGLTVA